MKEIDTAYYEKSIWPYYEDRPVNDKPLFIKFYSSICQPCKMMEPIIKQLEQEMPDVDFLSCNITDNPKMCGIIGITVVPSYMVINKEHKDAYAHGAMPKIKLKELIENHLKE